ASGKSSGSRAAGKPPVGSGGFAAQGPMPLLTSHCPGWTLYAEKVVDPGIIKHLSPLRPPQQVQGRLVKTCLLEQHNRRRLHRWWRARSPLFAAESSWWLRPVVEALAPGPEPLEPGDVYHVMVQPCFDRKIEASRPHFQAPGHEGVREVDTVLTATELLDLVLGGSDREASSSSSRAEPLELCPLDSEVLTDLFLGSLQAPGKPGPLICAVSGNAGSGGFIEHIFRESARELFQLDVPSVVFQTKMNDDMREVTLQDPKTQKTLLRFTAAHGFRNIQNVIRKVSKAGAGGDLRDC
ncbi:unnamed protein product, partial [Polarella glacialis]